jgi:hypothetical protein
MIGKSDSPPPRTCNVRGILDGLGMKNADVDWIVSGITVNRRVSNPTPICGETRFGLWATNGVFPLGNRRTLADIWGAIRPRCGCSRVGGGMRSRCAQCGTAVMAFDKPPLATPAIPTLFKVPTLFMCRSNSTQSPARIFVQTCLRPSARRVSRAKACPITGP